jgi:hypothetical protein
MIQVVVGGIVSGFVFGCQQVDKGIIRHTN